MTNDEKLKEKKLDSEVIYKGKIIDVYKDRVLCPNGNESYREVVRHCKASCILAITNEGKIIIERQYRYPYDEVIYEFPAGKCDEGEDPLDSARRELLEETGYYAHEVEYLGKMYPTCGYTDEVIYLYLAKNLEKREQHLDENEALNIYEISFDELIELVNNGELVDAKTLCAITLYQNRKR